MSYNYYEAFEPTPICVDCQKTILLAVILKARACGLPKKFHAICNMQLRIVIIRIEDPNKPDIIWTLEELGFDKTC